MLSRRACTRFVVLFLHAAADVIIVGSSRVSARLSLLCDDIIRLFTTTNCADEDDVEFVSFASLLVKLANWLDLAKLI